MAAGCCAADQAAAKVCGKDATEIEADKYKQINDKYIDNYLVPLSIAKILLSTIVGIYALTKQWELIKRQIDLAERGVDQAERYLVLAEAHYHNIAVPTWERQAALFDRYRASFEHYEDEYLAEAFRLKEYCPDYKMQEGRALGAVHAKFDRAAKQRARQIGRYNTGRCCHESLQFQIMKALASVDMANHAYRFEEAFKLKMDAWYWQRQGDGIRVVETMGNRVVNGINGGGQVAQNGLTGIGQAFKAYDAAANRMMTALANGADFWGGIANGAFKMAGYGMGRSQGSPFGMGSMGLGGYGGGGSIGTSDGFGMGLTDNGPIGGWEGPMMRHSNVMNADGTSQFWDDSGSFGG